MSRNSFEIFCQEAEVVEGMEVEDGVVGVREVMGEVGTGEVVAADGRAGENCNWLIVS